MFKLGVKLASCTGNDAHLVPAFLFKSLGDGLHGA